MNRASSLLVVAAITSAAIGPALPCAAQAQGLVAAYGFEEGTGSTVSDHSGNGNTGTLSAAAWTTQGRFGNALVFNGTNALVTVADSASLDLVNAMTLEGWVYPTAAASNWQDVIFKAVDMYYLEARSPSVPPRRGEPSPEARCTDPPPSPSARPRREARATRRKRFSTQSMASWSSSGSTSPPMAR